MTLAKIVAFSIVARRKLVVSNELMDTAITSPNISLNHWKDELIDGAFNNFIESRDN